MPWLRSTSGRQLPPVACVHWCLRCRWPHKIGLGLDMEVLGHEVWGTCRGINYGET